MSFNLQRVANDSQKKVIRDAIYWLARNGEIDGRLKKVRDLDLMFNAIMHEVYVAQRDMPDVVKDVHTLQFQRALHIARRSKLGAPPSENILRMMDEKIHRHVAAYREGVPAMMDSIVRGKIDVPTDANGMCYPKPNGGKRILPSIYTRIKQWWMRANGVTVEVVDMNDGHLENTMKLLQESHGNVIAKSTELLGKMANHFHNQPAVVQQLEDLCMAMQKVDVDAMYPIFKELATEAAQRKATPAMLVAVNPAWFEDGELNWGDK